MTRVRLQHVIVAVVVAGAVVLLSVVAGCGRGDGIERVNVSGKVTFAGEPVREGRIRFVPTEGTKAPLTIEKIVNGKYSTATSGGVPVGSYRVKIRAYDPDEPFEKGPGAKPRNQLLPDKYNLKSELKITFQSGQKQTTQNFDLMP